MNMLRRFTYFVLQGRITACALAFILAYLPIIGSISILIGGLVTLRKGAFEGALVFLAATIPYVLNYYSTPLTTLDIDLASTAIVIVIVSNILMWLFAISLRRYSSWGFILDLAALIGVGFIGIIHLVYPDIQAWWSIQLSDYFTKTAEVMKEMQIHADIAPTSVQVQMVNAVKTVATGLIVSSALFSALLQLMIARWWQAIVFNPGELRKELLNIRLSYLAGALFLICFALSSWGSPTAIDMMPVLYLIFSVAGLSIIHSLLAYKKKTAGLVFLYVGSVALMSLSAKWIGFIALTFSLIAFFDIGIHFRKRFGLRFD